MFRPVQIDLRAALVFHQLSQQSLIARVGGRRLLEPLPLASAVFRPDKGTVAGVAHQVEAAHFFFGSSGSKNFSAGSSRCARPAATESMRERLAGVMPNSAANFYQKLLVSLLVPTSAHKTTRSPGRGESGCAGSPGIERASAGRWHPCRCNQD